MLKTNRFLMLVFIGGLSFYSSLAGATSKSESKDSCHFPSLYKLKKRSSHRFWLRLKTFTEISNCNINNITIRRSWSILHGISYLKDSFEDVDRLLTEYGDELDVNIKTYNSAGSPGYAPLHFLAQEDHLESLKLLVEKRPDLNINIQDRNGSTPLMHVIQKREYAITATTFNIIDFLIRSGADTSIKNNKGKTVLELAREQEESSFVRYEEKGYSKVTKLLEEMILKDSLKLVEYIKSGDTSLALNLIEK